MVAMCMDPYCTERAVPSTTFPDKLRFCQPHQEVLDRCREEMNHASFKKSPRNKANVNERFCETSGCPNRPVYGGDYCADCCGGDI